VLFINYDEWGGFFDGVRPPRAADDRASANVADDFAQLGFRVPCTIVSPYARRGVLASRTAPAGRYYDHTSILKLIESRHGLRPLTRRDRAAADIGELLALSQPPHLDHDAILAALPRLRPESAPCAPGEVLPPRQAKDAGGGDRGSFERALELGFFERMKYGVGRPKLDDVLLG
jgi:phospholipase C